MSIYRQNLPQLSNSLFLSDGGLETTLVFQQGLDLPEFAACHLLRTEEGTEILLQYFRTYLDMCQRYDVGFILESPTWRANFVWGPKAGFSDPELDWVNRQAIELLVHLRHEYPDVQTVISGCIGPLGDGYVVEEMLTAAQAESIHGKQINILADTEADLVTSFTFNYTAEAVGFARAARKADIPAVISFTVETDGSLPSGQSLGEAIEQVDSATGSYPAYYMINCAHPSHFADMLSKDHSWTRRLRAVRANASCKSHAELEQMTHLDTGDPRDLGNWYVKLRQQLPHLNILGGCCGTDLTHIRAIADACIASNQSLRKSA